MSNDKKINIFFNQIEDIIKIAQKNLTYERVFGLLGINDKLRDMYIDLKDLNQEYVDILHQQIKNFIKRPLFKDLNLNNEIDLKYLKDNREFQSYLDKSFDKIKKELSPRRHKVLDFLKKFSSGEEISLDEIIKTVKLDKTSLLFILEDLKENNQIYDYNGREVTLN